MKELLLFTDSFQVTPVLQKIMRTWPGIVLETHDRTEETIPIGISHPDLTEVTFYVWAIEHEDVLPYLQGWALLSLDPPGWMQPILEALRYREEAKRLEKSSD